MFHFRCACVACLLTTSASSALAQTPPSPPKEPTQIACTPPCSDPPALAIATPVWTPPKQPWINPYHPPRALDGTYHAVFGVEATSSRATSADENGARGGATLTLDTLVFIADPAANFRYSQIMSIGGGGHGVQGALGLDLAGGMRLPTGAHQGVFFRVGARGYLIGDQTVYHSLLELPQLQLGWQTLRLSNHIELAGRAGPVLVGRYNTGDTGHRKLGSAIEFGGYGVVRFNPVLFVVDAMRVQAANDGSGRMLDVLNTKLCGVASGFGICTDVRLFRGDVYQDSNHTTQVDAVYGGLLVGMAPPAD